MWLGKPPSPSLPPPHPSPPPYSSWGWLPSLSQTAWTQPSQLGALRILPLTSLQTPASLSTQTRVSLTLTQPLSANTAPPPLLFILSFYFGSSSLWWMTVSGVSLNFFISPPFTVFRLVFPITINLLLTDLLFSTFLLSFLSLCTPSFLTFFLFSSLPLHLLHVGASLTFL